MSISMYSASVPVFTKMLGNLSYLLDKAMADAETRKYDSAVLMQYRLAPDMFPFTRQVLIACDTAKNALARLSGVEAPKFEDNEVSAAELKARIQKTLDFVATIKPEQLNGTEDKSITFPAGPGKTRTMQGEAYLKHHATPNLYFHVTTAYAILRHNGVSLGKLDYLLGAARDTV